MRRELLDDPSGVVIESGITRYRTFPIRAAIGGRPIWLVNVHAARPIWLKDGFSKMLAHLPWRTSWHYDEKRRLERWLAVRGDVPIVLAGACNAPHYARNLRLDGFHHAQRIAGRGPHLTFPAAFPIWGIDHVLANRHARFCEYRTLDGAPSDHRLQLARLGIR